MLPIVSHIFEGYNGISIIMKRAFWHMDKLFQAKPEHSYRCKMDVITLVLFVLYLLAEEKIGAFHSKQSYRKYLKLLTMAIKK